SRSETALLLSEMKQLRSLVQHVVRPSAPVAADHEDNASECSIHQPHYIAARTRRRVQCTCIPDKTESSRRSGSFTIFYLAEGVAHKTACPRHHSSSQQKAYGIRVFLWPLLSYTMEVAFTSICEAKGYAFAPTLRFYPRVQRSSSPCFAIIDEFRSTRK